MPRVVPALVLATVLFSGLVHDAVLGQTPTAADRAAAGTLLDVMVDRADLPGAEGFVLVGRNVFEPGARRTYANDDVVGTTSIIVESGELTYEFDGPGGRILRDANSASPTEEPSPTDAPFTLEAGDALVFREQWHVETNAGEESVSFLWAAVLEPTQFPPPDPSDVGEVVSTVLGNYFGPWTDLPEGPVALTMRRTSVEAGGSLPIVAGGLQVSGQVSGKVGDLLIGGDGAAINTGDESAEALVFTVVPTGTASAPPATDSVASSPAADAAETTIEPVAKVILVEAGIPEHPAIFDGWTTIWGPGDSYEAPSFGTDINIVADLVLTGDFTVHSAGRMQTQRGGMVEEITPGTDVAVGPGEAVVYVENSAAQGFLNPGQTPTMVVSFGVIPVAAPLPDYPGVVTKDDWQRSGLGDNDVAVTAERLTLPPGSSVPVVPDPAAPRFYAVENGTVEWVLSQPDGETPTLRFFSGQMIPFRPLQAGEELELRNAGNEPLELIQLTVGSETTEALATTPVA